MRAFGELWQMDTSVGAWLEGYRRVCVVVILDDYSRAVVAARVFATDSSYHSLLTLRQAMELYGQPRVLYTDNDSKFRLTRYQQSRFYIYRQETLEGLVETEIGRALRELDVQLLSHLPGNAQAKGKIERFFRFLQERVLAHNQAASLEELQSLVDRWVAAYNSRHVHRGTGCTPAQRLQLSITRPLEGNANDIPPLAGRSARWPRTTPSPWAALPTPCPASPAWSPSSCSFTSTRASGPESGTLAASWLNCPTWTRPGSGMHP
jgi:hypothetical protein